MSDQFLGRYRIFLNVVLLCLAVMLDGQSSFGEDDIRVPDFTGKNAQTANNGLRTLGLAPKFVLGQAAKAQDQAYLVFRQQPAAGSLVSAGTQIELTIYDAASPDSPATSPAKSQRETSQQGAGSRNFVIGHSFENTTTRARDLDHGRGARRLTVSRISIDAPDAAQPFGPGWSDRNRIVQTQIGADSLWLWRGGDLIATASRLGDGFQTDDGVIVRKTGPGWEWSSPRGEVLVLDAQGRATEIRSAFGRETRYKWDSQGRLSAVEQGQKNTLRYSYDSENHVTRIDGPEGLSCHYEYDATGRLKTVESAWKIGTSYEYNQDDWLIAVTDTLGGKVQPLTLDAQPESDSENQLSKAVRQERDELKLAAKLSQPTLPKLPRPEYEYNERGQVVSRSHRGNTTKYGYDNLGRIVSIKASSGDQQFEYDEFDRVVSVSGPSGMKARYQYSSLDEVLRADLSNGRWAALQFDQHARPIDWTFATGRSVKAEYGSDGYYKTVRWSPSLSATRKYDPTGRLLSSSQSSGRNISFSYDARGRLTELNSPIGPREAIAWNDAGLPVRWTVGDLVREFNYTDSRLSSITDPVFGERRLDYERVSDGEVSFTWDGLGKWTRQVNEWRKTVKFQRPSGQTWNFRYDGRVNLKETTTPLNRVWKYSQDKAGRMTGMQFPASHSTHIERSPEGRVTLIERNGIAQREFIHDQNGRVRLVSSPLGLAAAFSHDPVGRVKEVIVPDGKVDYSYDKFGLLDRVAGQDYEIKQEFHADGKLARRQYEPAGLDLKLPYDKAGRPAGVKLNEVGVAWKYDEHGRVANLELPGMKTITLGRDAAGRLTSVAYGTTVTIDRKLDRASRVVSLRAATSTGKSLFDEHYEYDAAGNLAQIRSVSDQTSKLTYDDDDRLTQVNSGEQITQFDYSLDDDLKSVTTDETKSRWELDNAGRPRMFDLSVVYGWDDAGNLTEVQSVDTDITNEFDAAGRLVQRTVAGLEWTFGYLPGGDRLWQQGPSGKVSYASLASGVVGWKDEENTIWLLVTLPGTDWPLAVCNSNGESQFLIADRLGSIRRVCDASGNVVSSSDYGPYGKAVAAEGFGPLNMYAGMLCDEHGLYYARRRYYDPLLSRFISLDPELGDPRFPGSLNAYAYAANNPYRYRDTGGTAPRAVDRGTPSISDKEAERAAARFLAQTPEQELALEVAFAGQDLLEGASSFLSLAAGASALSPWSGEDLNNAAQAAAVLAEENPAPDDLLGNLFQVDPNSVLFPPAAPSTRSPDQPQQASNSTVGGTGPIPLYLEIDLLDRLFTGIPRHMMSPLPGSATGQENGTGTTPNASSGLAGFAPASGAQTPGTSPASLTQGTFPDSGVVVAGGGRANGITPSSGGSQSSVPLGRLLNELQNIADDDLPAILRTLERTYPEIGVGTRGLSGIRTPSAANLPRSEIWRRIARNLREGKPPFDGIYEPPSDNALDRARQLVADGRAREQEFDQAGQDLKAKARKLDALADEILGPVNPFDDFPGTGDSPDVEARFDDLDDVIRKLNQLVGQVQTESQSFPVHDALARAKAAKERICNELLPGHDPANAAALHREADELLAKARNALDKANEFNASKTGNKLPGESEQSDSDKVRDELSQKIGMLNDLINDLEPLIETAERVGPLRDQFITAYNEWSSTSVKYFRMASNYSPLGGGRYGDSVPGALTISANDIQSLLSDFRSDPRSASLLQQANAWENRYGNVDMNRKPVAVISDLIGSQTYSRIKKARQLLGRIPDNAEELLEQARNAKKRAEAALKLAKGKQDRSLKDSLAGAYDAWQMVREAQNCRNRITTGPATGPLTGNIQAAELLKALSPRAVQLRPRHAESLIPGHPFSALGRPAELHGKGNTVAVPNVIGLAAPAAVLTIKKAGLTPSPKLGTTNQKGGKPFHVYQQSPAAGQRVAKNTTITLTISRTEPTLASKSPIPSTMKGTTKPATVPKSTPETKKTSKKPNGPDYSGTYAWANGPYAGFCTSFNWKQNGADAATVKFNMDGRLSPLLRKHRLPATVTTTVKRAGNVYEMVGDPLGEACSSAVMNFQKSQGNNRDFTYRLKITFTPAGRNLQVTLTAVSTDAGATGTFSGVATRK